MTDQTLPQTAHHEAGHFVAQYVLANDSVRSVNLLTIIPHGDTPGTCTGEYPLGEKWDIQEAEFVAIGLYAGHAAQVRYQEAAKEELPPGQSRDDDEQAEHFLDLIIADEPQDRQRLEQQLRHRADLLIDNHWREVETLASELLREEQLDGIGAEMILDVLNGKVDASALERLRRWLAVVDPASQVAKEQQ